MNQRGFTLLELLVATVIMAIAVVGLLSAISGSTRIAARLTDYDRAALLARTKMEELLVNRIPQPVGILEAPFDPALMGGLQGGWRARFSPFERPASLAPGSVVLERVELEIWWMSGEQRRSFTLDGFRSKTLRPEDVAALAPVP
jgi:general secretion pathway protein I